MEDIIGQQRRGRILKSSDTSVDVKNMSITAIISTPDEDRSGDIVEPMGGDFVDYSRNPVVFFNHATDFPQPIAKSQDETGLTVWPSEEGVVAEGFFSQTLPFARQIFCLWNEGILRAASINFIPTEATVRRGTGAEDRPGLHITQWKLLEWSVVGIPDNPYAIAKALHRGKLDGSPIDDSILRLLKRHAPKRKVTSPGFGPGKRFRDEEHRQKCLASARDAGSRFRLKKIKALTKEANETPDPVLRAVKLAEAYAQNAKHVAALIRENSA